MTDFGEPELGEQRVTSDAAGKQVLLLAQGGIDIEAAAELAAFAADISLVIDSGGLVQAVHCHTPDLAREVQSSWSKWVGSLWQDTVTPQSRPKIVALLDDASHGRARKWRQVNHPSIHGVDVPILYSAAVADAAGRLIAVGRDLRATAALQQRLVDAQHSMERDYWRLRHAETRYRLLFEMASEAVLVVDAGTQKILEANPAAGKLFDGAGGQIVGLKFPLGLDEAGIGIVNNLIAGIRNAGGADDNRARTAGSPVEHALVASNVRVSGRIDDVRVRVAGSSAEYSLAVSTFRMEQTTLLLVRMTALQPAGAALAAGSASHSMLDFIACASDAFVLTTPEGEIVTANRAFTDLVDVASEVQVRGESLERWLGRSGVDFNVLMANLRQRGAVRLFATELRDDHGSHAEVEVSAVVVANSATPCLGFAIRNTGGRVSPSGRNFAASGASQSSPYATGGAAATFKAIPQSVDQLMELVGRVPLKELVGETTDQIEKLCIEAALKLTNDNRAAAAEMLGVSRQSLYVKLRRYGMGDLPSDGGSEGE